MANEQKPVVFLDGLMATLETLHERVRDAASVALSPEKLCQLAEAAEHLAAAADIVLRKPDPVVEAMREHRRARAARDKRRAALRERLKG